MKPGFRARYERDVTEGLKRLQPERLLLDRDLDGLPRLLQTYLRRVGVVGRPRTQNFRARFRGEMRRNHGSGWMRIWAEQHTFLGPEPARLFLMKASYLGLPFEAFHRFVGPAATMQVRVASLFQVVDARGPEMDQGETVTFFNDLCLLDPAALLEADIQWLEIDEKTLRGTFHHQGRTVAADLTFNADGDLVNYLSGDRYQSADGKAYVKYPWSTPVCEYQEVAGLRLMARGDAVWAEPGGPFPYARFEVEDITYNLGCPSVGGTP